MNDRALLAYTPAYYARRFLQDVTEGPALLAQWHPFQSTPKQLVSCFTQWEVSCITAHIAHNTAKQSRDIQLRSLTSSLLPC